MPVIQAAEKGASAEVLESVYRWERSEEMERCGRVQATGQRDIDVCGGGLRIQDRECDKGRLEHILIHGEEECESGLFTPTPARRTSSGCCKHFCCCTFKELLLHHRKQDLYSRERWRRHVLVVGSNSVQWLYQRCNCPQNSGATGRVSENTHLPPPPLLQRCHRVHPLEAGARALTPRTRAEAPLRHAN